MTTEDMFMVLRCWISDWLERHPLPTRPGHKPRCTDLEILTFALAREVLGIDSERRFHRLLQREWVHLFPHVPAQSELNRRTRWLHGALELLRLHWTAQLPSSCSTLLGVDTCPLPVKHRTRARHTRHRGAWEDAGGLTAGFGYCEAKRWWFYGYRLAVLAPLADGVPRHWALCPAGVNEREVAAELLRGVQDSLVVADRGLDGAAMRALLAQQNSLLLTPPRKLRRYQPTALMRRFVRRQRNRVERPFQVLQDRFALHRHRAKGLWGLRTRLAAKLAAFAFVTLCQQRGLALD